MSGQSRLSSRLDGRVAAISRSGGGGTITVPAFSDNFALNVKFTDANAVPADAATFLLNLLRSDTNAVPGSETLSLKFPTPDFADANATPSEVKTFTMRVWLSGTAQDSTNGVTNPTNQDGANNATVTTYTSTAAGDANPRTHSALGANVPSGVTISSVIYRGWFKSVNTLVTSLTTLKLHSLTALFADVTMFSNAALNTTVDHLTGDFTFDVIAAGINTLAKIQSIQHLAATSDAAAGVTPAVLTIDAGVLEISGAFS